MSEARAGGFGPALLSGLGLGTLATLAATRTWATATGDAAGVGVEAAATGTEAAPLPWALALVVLATWGALLALRGRLRSVVAALGVLAAGAGAAAVLPGLAAARDRAEAAAVDRGAQVATVEVTGTPWPWVTVAALALVAAVGVVAVRRAPAWPSMSARYDAPGGSGVTPDAGALADDAGARELWDALDRGQDPTDPGASSEGPTAGGRPPSP